VRSPLRLAALLPPARAAGPSLARSLLASFAAALALAPPCAATGEERLTFVDAGGRETSLTKAELRARCGAREVTVQDAYYREPRRYLACPIEAVFELGFGAPPSALRGEDVLLRALDGYARSAPASQLASGGAFLALEDAARVARGLAGFDPIDRRQVDAGPFYLVWTGAGRDDPHRWPWPYQLARIEVVRFEARFPHAVPAGAPEGSPARRGFEIFRRECISCHAINGDGGTVGPDLNVPRSIVEYRPADQIKAYVRDPQSFRYTSMPSHLHLGDADLDALVAYFTHMSRHKRDPGT
jgi:mono/diheme cytochrome c family protein